MDGALDEFDGQITFSLYLLAMTGRSGVTEKGGKKKGKEKGKKENVVALHGILLRPAVTVTPGIYKYAESHYDYQSLCDPFCFQSLFWWVAMTAYELKEGRMHGWLVEWMNGWPRIPAWD